MPEVIRISQATNHPWSEEQFLRNLRQRNCIGMVAECGEEMVGYMLYELGKRHLEILNFAVSPKWQSQGIGYQMLERLKSKLSSHRRTKLLFYVPEDCLDMQIMLKKSFFQATSVIRNYFEDKNLDAYKFIYRLLPEDDKK